MGTNTNYDAPAYGCFITFLVITSVSVFARGLSRNIQKASFWLDDAFIYLAYVANTAALIVACTEVSIGGFDLKRMVMFSPGEASSFQKRNLAVAVLYIVIIACAKISALLLYRRIFGMKKRWFKILWWASLLLIVPCWFAITLGFLIWGQVDKFAFQTRTITQGSAASTLINAISDIMVLLLPIRCVLQLQISGKRKLGLISFFCFGLLTTCISIARAGMNFWQVANGPIPWNPAYVGFNYTVLALAETSSAVFCVSILITRPFFIKVGTLASSRASSVSIKSVWSKQRLSSKTSSEASDKSLPLAKDNEGIRRTVAYEVSSVPSQHNQHNQPNESASHSLDQDDMMEKKEHSPQATV